MPTVALFAFSGKPSADLSLLTSALLGGLAIIFFLFSGGITITGISGYWSFFCSRIYFDFSLILLCFSFYASSCSSFSFALNCFKRFSSSNRC